MNIKDYLKKFQGETSKIFNTATQDENIKKLGEVHHISAFIYEFSECLFESNEKKMLITVSSQIEMSLLNLTLGMYRQAFSSIRLAFEIVLGVVYFSVNKLDHIEWIKGANDIKWSKLIDEENGILSKRYSKAFFEELSNEMSNYNSKAKEIYREMSEFVHGNYDTWEKSGLALKYNQKLENQYFVLFKKMTKVVLFVLCSRYLKSIDTEKLENISEFIMEEMKDVDEIRKYLSKGK
ncbi:hypothetical protein O8C85_09355 [Aliarcobacter butzleri]|uniref:hypothetical protein n=1 Tax=Aliarcobacter butzleri TaxID=28197 RepID=UPI00263C712A|nr:hypothetical protein [Aliarcobacter butzleri]MDN5098739.1 hypothetical protein [Aliarcobacter butzleri]